MIFSLPGYRRLSQADLDRLRNDSDQKNSSRITRVLLNIILLVGLWTLPYYLRSLVLPEQSDTIKPSEAIIGRWQPSTGEGKAIEFTGDGEFRLSLGGIVKLTGHYRFDEWGDVILYDLNPPLVIDHEDAPEARYRVRLSVTQDGLTMTTPRQDANKSVRDRQHDRRGLPYFSSGTQFKRAPK